MLLEIQMEYSRTYSFTLVRQTNGLDIMLFMALTDKLLDSRVYTFTDR